MKHSAQQLFGALTSFAALSTLVLSAVSGCGSSPPSPPRQPPNHAVPWLSKKANNNTDADQYYRGIGAITAQPGGGERRETLTDYKVRNGFNANDGGEVEATYFNEADLRFGR